MGDLFRNFPTHALTWAGNLGLGVLLLVVFWFVSNLAARLITGFANRSDPGRGDVLLLLSQVARTALLIVGLLTALGTMGVNVSALVAGLGLTGFALGFAFRDALSNLLAGAMILFYRPFRRGDRIVVGPSEGTVIEINLRYTIVQNTRATVLIPNSTLLTNPITVHDKDSPRTDEKAANADGEQITEVILASKHSSEHPDDSRNTPIP